MVQWDLIVVGAGPGGSNAARVALDGGLTVVQVEARRFPRVKPCAGGVTRKAERALALPLAPALRRAFNEVEFNVWGRRINRFSAADPILLFVSRPEFDNHLVQQNRELRGFEFLDGEPVERITYDGLFHVTTSRRVLTGRQLVGADGAYSIVNRTFGVSTPRAVATAVEVNVARSRVNADGCVPCFDYGAVDRGYGWIFPKDDHLSVGLYTLAPKVRDLRQRIVEYMGSKGVLPGGDPLDGFEAHRIPVGGFTPHAPSAPVYVVGDAAGLADAVTGEGIYHAIESGRLAGLIACEVAAGRGSHRAYYRRLWRSVLPDTAATYLCAGPVFRNTDRAIRILENPLVWRPLIQGYSQGSTFTKSLLAGGCNFLRSRRATHINLSLS